MAYNLTQIANATDILVFTQNVNTSLMDGWLGTLFLIGLGAVLFMGFMWTTRDTATSLGATGFICFLFSLFLDAMNLVPTLAVFICLVGAAFGVMFIWRK